MATPSIQTLITQAQQVLNLQSSNEIRATLAAVLANANVGTPLNPNLTTQQLWDEFYEIVRQPSDDIMSIITDQMMRMVFSPPAPGGAGADKQVIFNDGGVLAGDTKFLWDKNANRLDVDGPVVITGDLTVDTSTLKVDSTNHRVGIGTATPGAGYVLDVVGAARITAANGLVIDKAGAGFVDFLNSGNSGANVGTSGTGGLVIYTANGIGGAYGARYVIDSTGISTWSVAGTTAMTLNSTGLGIGVTPSYAFQIKKTLSGTSTTVNGLLYLENNGAGNSAKITLTDGISNNGYIVYSNETGNPLLGLGVGSAQQLVVNSSGNVGIGVTPSAWSGGFKGLQISGGYGSIGSNANADTRFYSGGFYGTLGNTYAVSAFPVSMYQQSGGIHSWHTAAAGTAGNAITFTQAMTLDASGNLLVGKTSSANTVAGVKLFTDSVDGGREYFTRQAGAASQTHVVFFESGGGVVGSISTTNVATAYNIASDYRLKQSVQPLAGGLARVNSLKPSTYKWNLDGSAGEGFIAHELAEVVPFAVSGQKDAVNEDGSIKIQGVDLSKIVPILVAAIQELTTRVQTLEAR